MIVWWLGCSAGTPAVEDSSGPSSPGGPGTSSGRPEDQAGSEICERYLACATRVAPADLGDLAAQYGEDGSCWDDPSIADRCETACESGLSALQGVAPFEPECFDEPWCATGPVDLVVTERVQSCDQYANYAPEEWSAELQCDDLEHGVLTATNGVHWSVACTGDGRSVACASDTYEGLRFNATIRDGVVDGTLEMPFFTCPFEWTVTGTWPVLP